MRQSEQSLKGNTLGALTCSGGGSELEVTEGGLVTTTLCLLWPFSVLRLVQRRDEPSGLKRAATRCLGTVYRVQTGDEGQRQWRHGQRPEAAH